LVFFADMDNVHSFLKQKEVSKRKRRKEQTE
jgi:hypothetical protein